MVNRNFSGWNGIRLTALLFALILGGCGGGSSSDSSSNDTNNDLGFDSAGWPALQGKWESACFTRDGNDQRIIRNFVDNEVTQEVDVFSTSDQSCGGSLVFEATYTYAYQVGDELTTDTGVTAREIDVVVTSDPDDVIPPEEEEGFDIFHIDGSGFLYFADDAVPTEVDRPTAIDFSIPYTKI